MVNIILLGLVSLFVDISTEMVYPLIPIYLTTVFGATPALVGIIEGIAESLASLLKVWSGYIADKYKRKKPMAILGYSTALLYKLALILSTSWVGILFSRVIDRFGKGVRTAPRDVLVSENAGSSKQGMAFGLHKALDMAGSAIGILLAYFLMRANTGDFAYKTVFFYSMIPALIGIGILFFVKETKSKKIDDSPKAMGNLLQNFKKLSPRLKLFLVVAFVFNLGNSSNAFLLLRAQDVGFDASAVILLYFIYNLTTSLLALPFGKLSDKIGRRKLLVAGYIAFAVVYFGFGFAHGKASMVVLFVIYGIYTALTAGVERALIAQISPPELKGTMLGMHSSLVGLALLPASVIAGFLWEMISPAAPFVFGGTLGIISAIAIWFILSKNMNSHEAAK